MSALASKADTADLEALRGALGDACAELDALRARMAALSSTRNESAASSAPSTSGQPIQAELSGSGMDAASKALTGMARDVQVLKDNMDTLAHATNVLAVGLDNARASNTGEA